jgi:hypothetical protein
MASAAPHFEQFIRAVHRRLVLVRALERAGLGALTGCVAAGLLLPLLLWRAEPALGPAGMLIAMGAVAGLWWGVARRPSRLAAAMEADRQLGLHDLLGTAAGAGTTADASDPWLLTVLALADARCRRHTPSQVVLRRYGSRAWGGIGLAASLVLTLAALLSAPGTTPAIASRNPGAIAPAEARNPVASIQPPSPAAATGARRSVADPSLESRSIDSSNEEATSRPEDDRSRSIETPETVGRRSVAAGQDGQGGGAGKLANRRPRSPGAPTVAPPRSPPSSPADARANAASAGGGAEAFRSTSGTDADAAGGSASSGPDSPIDRVAPWESSTWPADAQAAQEAVEAGRVPDAYRDLVREYFDR